MNLPHQLTKFGLNGRQASVYLALLQIGPSGAIDIAKYTGLQHPTVYDALNVLKKRNLVSESDSERHKIFSAEPPDIFEIEEKLKLAALKETLPVLRGLYEGGPCRPKIRFYTWHEGVRVVYRNLLEAREKQYFYYGTIEQFLVYHSLEEELDFIRERVKRGIRSYSIRANENGESLPDCFRGGEELLREVRFFPRNLCPDLAAVYIYDDSIAIASGIKENYCAILESREFHDFMKNIWNILWAMSEKKLISETQ